MSKLSPSIMGSKEISPIIIAVVLLFPLWLGEAWGPVGAREGDFARTWLFPVAETNW